MKKILKILFATMAMGIIAFTSVSCDDKDNENETQEKNSNYAPVESEKDQAPELDI